MNTPKFMSGQQIPNLRKIQREFTALEVSECLFVAKSKLGRHIENTIAALIAFVSDDEHQSAEYLRSAEDALKGYQDRKNECRK